MAGKYALYLPYKVLDSLSSGNVTDSQFREFVMGLAEYDRTGTFPASPTPGFSMMFELVRSDLDFAKDKYEDIIKKRSEAGKQGGAPAGNQNASKDGNSDQAPEPESEKQTQAKTSKSTKSTKNKQKQAKQAESVVSSKITDTDNSSQLSVLEKQLQTTDFLELCKTLGYSLDSQAAQKIMNSGIEPLWLSGAFTYPEYVAEYVKESYPDKSRIEHHKLFISALSWEDRRIDFSEWRKNKIAEAATRDEQRKRESAIKAHPTECEYCGGKNLQNFNDEYQCSQCEAICSFDTEKIEWVWRI